MTSVSRLITFFDSMSTRDERVSLAHSELPTEVTQGLPSIAEPCGVGDGYEVPDQKLLSGNALMSNGGFGGTDDEGPGHSVSEALVREVSDRSDVPVIHVTASFFEFFEKNNQILGEDLKLLWDEYTASDVLTGSPYSVLSDITDDDECTQRVKLGQRAKILVVWFARELHIEKLKDAPTLIECGGLRSAVRSCFGEVDSRAELSFKTVQKIEKSCCSNCEPRFKAKLSEWEEARLAPVVVDAEHLCLFRQALLRNVEKGWDRQRRIFIPNGNATLSFTRRQGGNWNNEPFSDQCRKELVFSSGKPRVVTLYSSHNTKVLAPLHYSMYSSLKKRGWLLVGDPTDEHVQRLNGSTLLSFDYSSATDNIKADYVRTAIDVLKERADYLSSDENAALDVLGTLNLGDGVASSGQPMGSVMSFPLLCLINKTVVDLALTDLLCSGSISFLEWTKHMLFVNGDDLLTSEPRKNTDLRRLIADHGSKVGLIVNQEKTMASDIECEINSTLFRNGKKCTKFNAAAIWMSADTDDVLGLASQACDNGRTFRRLVRSNARTLSKQSDKKLDLIPSSLQAICRKDPKIRKAITSQPDRARVVEKGVISMAPRPENYNLGNDEEQLAMSEEVERVRERGIFKGSVRKPLYKPRVVPHATSYSSVLKKKRSIGQELLPSCYVRANAMKIKEALVLSDLATRTDELLPPGDGSVISRLSDNLRAFKKKRNAVRVPGTFDAQADYVSLDC